MPHLFVHRKRRFQVFGEDPYLAEEITSDTEAAAKAFVKASQNWETINSLCYSLGGLTFIVGSVFFFPKFEENADVGVWLFLAGSILYLLVNIHDLMESMADQHHRKRTKKSKPSQQKNECGTTENENGSRTQNSENGTERERTKRSTQSAQLQSEPEPSCMGVLLESIIPWVYFSGTTMFLIGSICFLSSVGEFILGGYLFVFGSLAFLFGALMNIMQIVTAHDAFTLQLINLTAMSFVIGSTLFAAASIPYCWKDIEIPTMFLDLMTWMYLIGSVLFLFGGACNYGRAKRYSIDLIERLYLQK